MEVGDSTNDLGSIFGSNNIDVYGFAIQGCAEFDTDCLPRWYAINIVCLLPRETCDSKRRSNINTNLDTIEL